MLREVAVSVPPLIAGRRIALDATAAADLESAMHEITALDTVPQGNLAPLGLLLLRTESVASSRIESIEAGVDDYARALHGIRSNPSAVSMVAATAALGALISDTGAGIPIRLDAITTAHALLMRDDRSEAAQAGRVREVQNWIGGSDWSPRGALFVPPPPELVPGLLTDLVTFANRDDLPVLVQAALAHAQFESIHPFTDGNGRIGRALINTIFRRRGATTRTVVPLASSLVAHRDRYFDTLTAYRGGDLTPLLTAFTAASRIAAAQSRVTATRLAELPEQWREQTGPLRAGSAAARLLAMLQARPVLSAEDACGWIDAARSSVFAAITRLHEVGVLRPLTNRGRDQVWGAAAVLDELDDLGVRIAADSR